MILGSGGIRIVKDGWDTMARCFAQFDISVYNGLENQFLEMSFHFIIYLIGQSEARIKHGQKETFYFQSGVQLGFYNLDGVQQFANSFQREIFALYRDDNRISRSKCIDCNQSQ